LILGGGCGARLDSTSPSNTVNDPCCGAKPAFTDAKYAGTFSGQIAVVTCLSFNLNAPVLGIVDLRMCPPPH